jgi:hypothetical protein
MAFSVAELIALAQAAGFTGDDATIAGAVAMAESSGNPNALGDNGQSYGLWQINVPSHPGVIVSQLYDPTYNAKIAKSTFDAAKASKATGYNGFQPWTTYNTGAYKKFMPGASPKPSTAKTLLVPVAIGVGVLGAAAVAAFLIRRERVRALVPQAA